MKSRKRKFAPEGTQHIYKRTENGGLLFYTLSDYLVFFTITCVAAEKNGNHAGGIDPDAGSCP